MLNQAFGGGRAKPLSDKQKVVIAFVFMGMLIAFIGYRISTGFTPIGRDDIQPPRTQQEMSILVRKTLVRHMTLPPGDPLVERITRPDWRKLVNPSFYKDVQVNDLMVHYPELVILYRPSTDQVIAKAPVVSGDDFPTE